MNSSKNTKKKPFISVIIPTYHDWQRLQLCLNALSNQTYSQDNFEIIVVNNDPKDLQPDELRIPSNCIIISEGKPGSYAARNAGARQALGKIYSFTDSDCVPVSNWLDEIAMYFSDRTGILTGFVEMFSVRGEDVKLNFAECYDYVFGINNEIYAQKQTGATANLSVDKFTFSQISGFDSSLFSGGDIEFCKRAVNNGADFTYMQEVVVMHPLRSEKIDLLIKARRLAGGKVKLSKLKGTLVALSPPVVRIFILFFKKKAPLQIKAKALTLLFYIKIHQAITALKVLAGRENERN